MEKRVIKFRAWDGKKMYLPEFSDKEDFHLLPDGTIVETHEHGFERHELTTPRGKDWIVMQFTGLRDKNGKEIYGAEIIFNDDRKEIGVVKWSDSKGMWVLEYVESKDIFPLWESLSNLYYSIGNIYENPELLTK